jgi:alkylation response protein AidB-like acyl-CoA dehydrogenase
MRWKAQLPLLRSVRRTGRADRPATNERIELVDLTPDSDQQQLVDAAIAFLSRTLPVSRLHGGEDARLPLRALMAEQGWCSVGLAEEADGMGLGAVEEVLVLREVGRVLGPTHVLHNALAAQLAAASDQHGLAKAFAAGSAAAALAVPDGPVRCDAKDLSGPVRLYDCHDASHYLFLDERAAWLLTAPTPAPALRPCLDKSITMTTTDLAGLRVVAQVDGAALYNKFVLLVAAMLQGGAEATRDMICGYAKVRETFGRKIGSYQAVRHPIAEMAARCEQAKALLFYAALSMDERRGDAPAHASAALMLATRTALLNADVNIQLHGGVGLTDAYDAHLYLKRAHVLSRWCGLARAHLERVIGAELTPL